MGVLDDAIREHLDLKRQHGASDQELAREEAEALGPARREVPQRANDSSAVASDEELLFERETSEDRLTGAGAGTDEPLAEDEVPATELLQDDELTPATEDELPPAAETTARYDEEALSEEELVQEPDAAEALEPRDEEERASLADVDPELDAELADDDLLDDPDADTHEHELADDQPETGDERDAREDAPESETPAEETAPEAPADELEETPDFLEETPEHDRLWFEQKPPRDFDFDE